MHPSFSEEMEDVRGRNGNQKESEAGVRYTECMRNYALGIGDALSQGREVRDGCCQFTPAGPEGTAEFFLCEACHCHRNFHRPETEGQLFCESCYHRGFRGARDATGLINPLLTTPMAYAVRALGSRTGEKPRVVFHSPVSAEEDSVTKRFRTKFTAEQKDRMLSFSQRVGWKIQRCDPAEVVQFCQEIGVERKVLRAWMQNNKHAFTKPSQPLSLTQNATAMELPSPSPLNAADLADNYGDQVHDNTETTATNSISNNDSQSEKDFQ